ncbi:MAG: hypothetical protein B5M51_02260 [Anaerolinea sp. 4484_236]|nr:MAG: hypothetical protein B5M51_02260 [Anaerolinea sp. 4484_236]RLD06649.1 MAG: hypothetical protein DRI56_07790 [Chloroflexota bacterium]
MKRFVIAFISVLAIAMMVTSPVAASPMRVSDHLGGGDSCDGADMCISFAEALTLSFNASVKNMLLSIQKAVASVAWLLDKAALEIFYMTIYGDVWGSLRTGILGSFAAIMPNVLTGLLIGDKGLLYIALGIAGVSMTIPFANTRLVDPGQAILWTVMLIAIFGAGTMGYDLIGGIEEVRVGMMTKIIGGEYGNEGGIRGQDIRTIVTAPMLATVSETSLSTNSPLLQLPEEFEDEYFIGPQGYMTVRTVFFEGPASVDAVSDMKIETSASLETREAKATPGMVIALLSLLGGYVAFLFAIIFALLMTASLGLIIFLFASLPLGLFEFGKSVVAGIFDKYIQIVILSLGAAIFTAIVSASVNVISDVSLATGHIGDALKRVAVLMPILGVQHMFIKWAFESMMDSRNVFKRTMSTVFSSGKQPPGMLRQRAAGVARTVGTAATLLVPGIGGIAFGMAANKTAGILEGQESGGIRRGDVFRQIAISNAARTNRQKDAGGNE